MSPWRWSLAWAVCVALICGFANLSGAEERAAGLPSDTPPEFKVRAESFDYVKREEMIPMRDGVKLKTFILIPRGASKAPILLTRTPYDAAARVLRFNSPHLAAAVPQMDETAG